MSEGYIIGGGGSALNFKVIAVSSELLLPATAKENTIAVITDTAITSYVFSVSAPTSPAEGMVWFATGTASTVGFNATKENGLWVYPTGCQQYVSGEWVQKAVKTYRDSAWVDWWNGYLYDSGNEYDFVTGGWKANGVKTTAGTSSGIPTIQKNANYLHIESYPTAYYGGGVQTTNRISMRGRKTLTVIGQNVSNYSNAYMHVGLYTQIGTTQTDFRVANAQFTADTSTIQTVTIDVTNLNDDYYVMFTGIFSQNPGEISKLDVYEVSVT